MGIDLQAQAFLSAFRIEYMRLSGKPFEDATKAAFDWMAGNPGWRQIKPAQAAGLALCPQQPGSLA